MRAIEIDAPGAAHSLTLRQVPDLRPGPGQVLVRPAAIGVNFIDTYFRTGAYPADFPLRPGLEGAGEVVAVGDDVTVSVGEGIAWVSSVTGSYAEAVLVDAAMALPIPDGVDLEIAAAVALQGLTVSMLVDGAGQVRPGQNILITAGAGGVGLLLTQVAAHLGAAVITTVSTAAKEQLSRAAGATEVLRYDGYSDMTSELSAAVRTRTGEGVDIAYDGVGLSTFDASLASLRPRGQLVVFGAASGPVPPFDVQRLNRAGSVSLTRPTMFHFIADPHERARRWQQVCDWLTDGALDVRIGARFPLADAAQAHTALEGRDTTGKVLLIP
ncbi:MAG: quinone oxidoreductase family protein [Beutenbergiaceae bacterium]